jgi:hypothetical protein
MELIKMVGTWIKLATATASGSSKTLSSGSFTTKKYLRVEAYGDVASGNMDNIGWRFNEDVNSNYTYDSSIDYDSGNNGSGTYIRLGGGSATGGSLFVSTVIANKSSNVKICTSECCKSTGTGSSSNGNNVASTNLHSFQTKGKWNNSSDNITSIQLKHEGSANWSTNSTITVWGASEDTVSDEKTTLADATVTTTPTPTVTDDLTTDDGWVSTSSDWAYNASDYLYLDPIRRSTTSQQIYIDLQDSDYLGSGNNLHATEWVTRFKFETETLTSATGNAEVFIGLSDTSGASAQATNQDMVYLSINGNSNEPIFYFYGVAGTGMLTSRTGAGFSPSISNSTTTFYCEIVRNSDVYTARVTTSDDYTGGSTATITKSGLTDLRWLKLSNDNEQNGQTWKGKLHEVKIYNGVTSAASTTSSAAPPANTRYEEVDTRKIYRMVGDTIATLNHNFASGLSPLTVNSFSSSYISATGGILDCNFPYTTGNSQTNYGVSARYDFGADTVSETNWVLRWKAKCNSFENSGVQFQVGLTDGDDSVYSTATQTSIACLWQQNSSVSLAQGNASSNGLNGSDRTATGYGLSNSTYYYFEMKRLNATSIGLKVGTSAYGGTEKGNITHTTSSGVDDLRYLTFTKDGRACTADVVEVIFLNNTTSGTVKEWKERGTA